MEKRKHVLTLLRREEEVKCPGRLMTNLVKEAWHPQTREEAMLGTLRFFAIWNHPLTIAEIQKYLLKIHPPTGEEINTHPQDTPFHLHVSGDSVKTQNKYGNAQFEKRGQEDEAMQCCLEILLKRHLIITDGTLYTLHDHPSAFAQRKSMEPILKKRLRLVRRYAPLLQSVPFVRGVFLCNNLSFGIATETGDIDLCIVTAPGHIFTARFLCTAIFHLLGVRRHGSKTTNRFCLSFYVTQDNLDFSSWKLEPQDIYLAYWTLSLVPCFPTPITAKILEANHHWLQNEFEMVECFEARPPLSKRRWSKDGGVVQRLFESLLFTPMGRWIEEKIAVYQKRKLTRSLSILSDSSGTVISGTILKFHDRDRRREYQKLWNKKDPKVVK